MEPKLFESFTRVAQLLQDYRGFVSVEEALSIGKGSLDRHCCATSTFRFVLDNFAVRFSGAVAMFLGSDASYEIFTDQLVDLHQTNHKIVFLEKLSTEVYRQSTIRLEDRLQAASYSSISCKY